MSMLDITKTEVLEYVVNGDGKMYNQLVDALEEYEEDIVDFLTHSDINSLIPTTLEDDMFVNAYKDIVIITLLGYIVLSNDEYVELLDRLITITSNTITVGITRENATIASVLHELFKSGVLDDNIISIKDILTVLESNTIFVNSKVNRTTTSKIVKAKDNKVSNIPKSGKIINHLKNYDTLWDIVYFINRMVSYGKFNDSGELSFLESTESNNLYMDLDLPNKLSNMLFDNEIKSYLGNKFSQSLFIENYEPIGIVAKIREYCKDKQYTLTVEDQKDMGDVNKAIMLNASSGNKGKIEILIGDTSNAEVFVEFLKYKVGALKSTGNKNTKYIWLFPTAINTKLLTLLNSLGQIIQGIKFELGIYPTVYEEMLTSICLKHDVFDFEIINDSCINYITLHEARFDKLCNDISTPEGLANIKADLESVYDDNKLGLIDTYLNIFKNVYSTRLRSRAISLLFTGSPGTGKTYFPKCIAKKMFNDNLLLVNMNTFRNVHAFESWLLGASAMYVGYDKKPEFQVFLDKCGNEGGVVVLDESDKTTTEVLDMFLDMLETNSITFRGENAKSYSLKRITFVFAGNWNLNQSSEEINIKNISPALKSRQQAIYQFVPIENKLNMIRVNLQSILEDIISDNYGKNLNCKLSVDQSILNHPRIISKSSNGRELNRVLDMVFAPVLAHIYNDFILDTVKNNHYRLSYNNKIYVTKEN